MNENGRKRKGHEHEFSPEFLQDYRKLDLAWKVRVDKAIDKIIVRPELGKPLHVPFVGFRSERIGSSRIIYTMKGNRVIFAYLKHRKKAY